jgi:hypothetical protein
MKPAWGGNKNCKGKEKEDKDVDWKTGHNTKQ